MQNGGTSLALTPSVIHFPKTTKTLLIHPNRSNVNVSMPAKNRKYSESKGCIDAMVLDFIHTCSETTFTNNECLPILYKHRQSS